MNSHGANRFLFVLRLLPWGCLAYICIAIMLGNVISSRLPITLFLGILLFCYVAEAAGDLLARRKTVIRQCVIVVILVVLFLLDHNNIYLSRNVWLQRGMPAAFHAEGFMSASPDIPHEVLDDIELLAACKAFRNRSVSDSEITKSAEYIFMEFRSLVHERHVRLPYRVVRFLLGEPNSLKDGFSAQYFVSDNAGVAHYLMFVAVDTPWIDRVEFLESIE